MQTFSDIASLQKYIQNQKQLTKKIGFVPTMGALHDGHSSLVHKSTDCCDITIVSIFVNPTQFGQNEDLDTYPRPLDTDLAICEDLGVDAVFTPIKEDIYLGNPNTGIIINDPELSKLYCGVTRPHFFQGVLSVVLRLFNIVQPDQAFFGEKDFQQLTLIKKMVRELFLPIKIIPCPIIRESDGLALSSRNAYLSPQERSQATAIYKSMQTTKLCFKNGESDTITLLAEFKKSIKQLSPIKIDYAEIVDPKMLTKKQKADHNDRLLFAGYLGKTRLIDNIAL